MKKPLLIMLATGMTAVSALAQGTIAFQANSANGLISYSIDSPTSGLYPTTGLAFFGPAHIGFYTAPNGTVLSVGFGFPNFTTAWTANSLVVPIAVGPGMTQAKTITDQQVAGGANDELEVVGWTGTATSWAAAVASSSGLLGWSGEFVNGTAIGALGWSQPTGNQAATPPGTPATLVTGPGGYEGIVFFTPEPSTITLGALGVAALFAFRRRK